MLAIGAEAGPVNPVVLTSWANCRSTMNSFLKPAFADGVARSDIDRHDPGHAAFDVAAVLNQRTLHRVDERLPVRRDRQAFQCGTRRESDEAVTAV